MDKWERNLIKMVSGGILIFVIGIIIGRNLDTYSISSIQGYLFNAAGEATDANATDANATDANATDANATDANATDANASDANASLTDNIIYLLQFRADNITAKSGERVPVAIDTAGAPLSGATIILKNNNLNETISVKVESIYDNPYFIVPDSAVNAEYIITDLLLVGRNSDGTTFSKKYSKTSPEKKLDSNFTLTVNNTITTNIELTGLSFNQGIIKKGEKLYLKYIINEKVETMKIRLDKDDGYYFTAGVKSLNDKTYIDIPISVSEGTYRVTKVIITSNNTTKIYDASGANGNSLLTFQPSIKILGEKSSNLYSNADITSNDIATIYSLTSDIKIDATEETIINEDLFKAIKGKNNNMTIIVDNNEIIFNGQDVNDPKTIDVSMEIDEVINDAKINQYLQDGVVLHLKDNGSLPGSAKYRIYDEGIEDILNDKINVYYFNETYNKFILIAEDIEKTSDGYYEFVIKHNSDYILTNEKIAEELTMADETNEVVDFQKSNKINLLLIIGGIIVVIIITAIVIIIRRKNNLKST